MSALIIGDHVKRGLDLAEQIKLPSIVRRGIPEHHGTTVMRFFYQKALEQDAHGQVTEDDFRYPGPKPQSAETAILMLADSVEATARTISEPNTAAIRAVVVGAIDTRLREGQLEECGLSIRDLARIRESFVTTLLSIYHPRIIPRDKARRAVARSALALSAGRGRRRGDACAADREEPELPAVADPEADWLGFLGDLPASWSARALWSSASSTTQMRPTATGARGDTRPMSQLQLRRRGRRVLPATEDPEGEILISVERARQARLRPAWPRKHRCW
jgi:hypothetical protein